MTDVTPEARLPVRPIAINLFIPRTDIKDREVMTSYLDVGARIYFVDSVTRGATSLAVQIIALYKDGELGEAADPHIALTHYIQLHAFADVETRFLRLF